MRLRLAVLLVVLVAAPAAHAATITVDTFDDVAGIDGHCSLREAAQVAANPGSASGAPGECPAGSAGVDDIVLQSGHYLLNSSVALADVNVIGAGSEQAATTVIDGQARDRVLTANGAVTLSGVTVAGGLVAPAANSGSGLGVAGGSGGGVLVQSGTLTVQDSRVVSNQAGRGGDGASNGAVSGADVAGEPGGVGGQGGAIAVDPGAALHLERVLVDGNRAGDGGSGGSATGMSGGVTGGKGFGGLGGSGGSGGGLFLMGAAVIEDSTITNNHAGNGGSGGAGFGGSGTSTDGDGQGGDGGIGGSGGVLIYTATLTLTRTTIASNRAGDGGPGASGSGYFATATTGQGGAGGAGGDAGGLSARSTPGGSSQVWSQSTFTANRAGDGGTGGGGHGGSGGSAVGGIGGDGGAGGAIEGTFVDAGMLYDTVTGNLAGSAGTGPGGGGQAGTAPGIRLASGKLTLARSVLAGCEGALTDLGSNFGSGGCPGNGAGPILGPLQDNGGSAPTMRPLPGSPVIDSIAVDGGCAGTDERGATRPVGAGCDAGAVEIAAPTVTTGDPITGTVDGHGLPTTVSFDFGPSSAYGSSLAAGTLTAAGPTGVSASPPPLLPGTYHYRATAGNVDGSSAGGDRTLTVSGPGGGTGSAPVVSKLTFKPRRLKRGRKATVRFTISEAANVKLSFAKRRGRHYRAAGSLTRKVKAGAVRITFKRRALKPGRYRLALVATDTAKRRSKPVSTTFTVVAA